MVSAAGASVTSSEGALMQPQGRLLWPRRPHPHYPALEALRHKERQERSLDFPVAWPGQPLAYLPDSPHLEWIRHLLRALFQPPKI